VNDTALALLAIAAGSLFCFAGYRAFRIIIALWAGLIGFSLGAGAVAATSGDNFLATGLSWLVALGCAVAFAVVAYLFYEVAVLAMASIGFSLGASVMVAVDVRGSWLVALAGVAVGAVLGCGRRDHRSADDPAAGRDGPRRRQRHHERRDAPRRRAQHAGFDTAAASAEVDGSGCGSLCTS
jgi:hypothetical protein